MTEENLPRATHAEDAGFMAPDFAVFLYAYLVVLLAVLSRWEYKRAMKRCVRLRLEGFSRQSKL